MKRYSILKAIYSKIAQCGKKISELAINYMEYDMDFVVSKTSSSEAKEQEENNAEDK